MKDKNIKLELEYSLKGLVFALLFYIFGVSFCLFIMFYGNLFFFIVGLIGFIGCIYTLLDIWFFRRVIFTNYYVIKEWNAFEKSYFHKIKYKNLELQALQKRLISGHIVFKTIGANYFKTFCFQINLIPISKKDLKKVKEVLIIKRVLRGDEYEWNY